MVFHPETLENFKFEISKVNDFKYLGSYVSSSLKDFNSRKGLAYSAFRSLKKIWNSNLITLERKINIFSLSCIPILLYGCETWIIGKKLSKKINSFATDCYRTILGIKRIDRIKNEEILKGKAAKAFRTDLVKKRQLNFTGRSYSPP